MQLIRWIRRVIYTYSEYVPILNRIIDWKKLIYSCQTKIKYSTKDKAIKAVVQINSKKTTRNELEHYRCSFCEGWHLGRKKRV